MGDPSFPPRDPHAPRARSPVEGLLDRVQFRCTCCGTDGPAGGRGAGTCRCWSGDVDRCDAPEGFGCAEHCACARCAANRADGFQRVNWTGLQHIARTRGGVLGDRTLCGHAVGGPPVWRRPMLRLRGDECARCATRYVRDGGDPGADPGEDDAGERRR